MNSALLLMDFQPSVVSRFGNDAVVARAGTALAAARDKGVLVIFVRVAFRPGMTEGSPFNKTFNRESREGTGFTEDDPSTQVVDALAPRGDEAVMVKRRVGAFSGTDLDVVLRANAIDHLVLCGIATSGVVLSTVRLAADRDFRLTVLADACSDGDDEVHRVLVDKVFPRQAEVTSVAAWLGQTRAGVEAGTRSIR
jgi:nicotinamidase-related amidase